MGGFGVWVDECVERVERLREGDAGFVDVVAHVSECSLAPLGCSGVRATTPGCGCRQPPLHQVEAWLSCLRSGRVRRAGWLVPFAVFDKCLGVCSGSGRGLGAFVGLGPALVVGRTVAMVNRRSYVRLNSVGYRIVGEA